MSIEALLPPNEIEQAKKILDDLLDEILENTDEFYVKGLKDLVGLKISTNPEEVSKAIDSEFFYGKCGRLCGILTDKLQEENIPYTTMGSEDNDNNGHRYFRLDQFSEPIFVDPSIGQFIEGHNHVFVGTRRDLNSLILEQTGNGKPYRIINTRSKNNPEEALSRTWGNKGSTVYSFQPKK